MTTFLEHVAQHIIKTWGTNLSNLTIVMPGQRAALFMNDYLVKAAGSPVWAPRYATIDNLFLELSGLRKVQPVELVCRLYDIYKNEVADPMSLDDFYGWGEILLGDFDDIDKHMVNANLLFDNVAALQEAGNIEFLNTEQKDALRDFFSNFNQESQSIIKQRFIEIWKAMPVIYQALNKSLEESGLGYTGGIYRRVAQRIREESLPEDFQRQYAFVGFNVLDEVEQTLFAALQENGKATFYWDYDQSYFMDTKHEAGLFMRKNISLFPNALPDDIYDNLLSKPKKIRFIATTTDNAQVRYVPQWIEERLTPREHESAIILCDETLVQPLMSSIPSQVDMPSAPREVNITMGFPLHHTPIHGYLMTLLELQTYGYDDRLHQLCSSFIKRVKDNPFYAQAQLKYIPDDVSMLCAINEELECLSHRIHEEGKLNEQLLHLYNESIFQCYCLLNQFIQLIECGTLKAKRRTLMRLIKRAMQSVNVPFHGEMDRGMQVMGLLEARNLDFRHLLMLSVGEGFLPKKTEEISLIPYSLKPVFNLSTIERKTAVFAYYFYRTIQRAEDITLMYNDDNSNSVAQREQSRFLRQLLAETELDIHCLRLESEITIAQSHPIVIEKTAEIIKKLEQRFDNNCGAKHYLSPTAINNYLSCPLKFFFQNVLGISVPVETEEFDSRLFGTLFHDSAEMFYTHLRYLKSGSWEIEATDFNEVLCEKNDSKISRIKKDMLLMSYIDLSLHLNYYHADQYNSYSEKQAREDFLKPFLQTKSRVELMAMVNGLYAEQGEENRETTYRGMVLIVRDIILRYLKQLLSWDKMHAPFKIYALEQGIYGTIKIDVDEKEREIRIGGRVDRMDFMIQNGQEVLRIEDYKTSRPKTNPTTIEEIFHSKQKNAAPYYLQTFLYASILHRSNSGLRICPSLFYVKDANNAEEYSPLLQLNKTKIYWLSEEQIEDFTTQLSQYISEIFDPRLPFTQTGNINDVCKFCDFKDICNRRGTK